MTEKELIVDDDRVHADSWSALAALMEQPLRVQARYMAEISTLQADLAATRKLLRESVDQLTVRTAEFHDCQGRLGASEDRGRVTGEELTAVREALKAEIARMNALENVRADFLLRMIGNRSLEHFVVRWDELQAENRRLRAALEKYADEKNWNGWHVTAKPWSIACEALVER